MANLLVIVGGSRGISKSLSQVFSSNGYKTYHLSRDRPDFKHSKHIYMDIEIEQSIDSAIDNLVKEINVGNIELVSFHFMTGGSLGLYLDQISSSPKKYNQIAFHNLIFPLWFTEQIYSKLKNKENLKFHFNYYFSAVQGSLDAHPMYVASKSGLESAFKAFVCQRNLNASYSGYVLGIVNVEHKYLYKLSKENPIAFDEILNAKIPNLNFADKYDIAKFIFSASKHLTLSNGMIVDISGGGSWIKMNS